MPELGEIPRRRLCSHLAYYLDAFRIGFAPTSQADKNGLCAPPLQ
jgi:hypothetical protein